MSRSARVRAAGVAAVAVAAASAPAIEGSGLPSLGVAPPSDDGVTWQPVTQTMRAGGWAGGVKVAKQQGGFLSVRAGASTDTGGRIQQQIIRAYGLR